MPNTKILYKLPIDTIISELKYQLVRLEEKRKALSKIMSKHPDDYNTYFIYQDTLKTYRRIDKEVETLIEEIKRRMKK